MIDFSRRARPYIPPRVTPPAPPRGSVILGTGDGEVASLPPPTLQQTLNFTAAAQAGGGKTALLANIVSSSLEWSFRNELPHMHRCFVVVDPKGDLIDYCLGGIASHPALVPSLRYCNIFARRGAIGAIPLNFTKIATTDPPSLVALGTAHLLARTAVGGGVLSVPAGHRQTEVGAAAVAGAYDCDHERASLLFAVDCLELPDGPERLAQLCPSERVRAQLRAIPSPGSEPRVGALSRLKASLTGWYELEQQMSAPDCVSFETLTAAGCTFVDLSDAPTGASELVNVTGNLLVSEIMRYLLARPTGFRGHNCTVLVDEALQFTDALSTYGRRIYEIGRSKAVSCWLAVQQLRGLRDTGALYHAIVANCTNTIYGRQGYEDATAAAREVFGNAGSAEAIRFVADLVGMPPQQFYLAQPGRRVRFSATHIDFRAWEAAARQHEAQLLGALSSLSRVLPPPVRLHEVGGPRTSAALHNAPRRRGSFIG